MAAATEALNTRSSNIPRVAVIKQVFKSRYSRYVLEAPKEIN